MVNWVNVKDGMPTHFQNVLVSGGVAYWNGKAWYTCMEPNHPEIEWEVEYWAPMPKPPNRCPDCDALRVKIIQLKEQVAAI